MDSAAKVLLLLIDASVCADYALKPLSFAVESPYLGGREMRLRSFRGAGCLYFSLRKSLTGREIVGITISGNKGGIGQADPGTMTGRVRVPARRRRTPVDVVNQELKIIPLGEDD